MIGQRGPLAVDPNVPNKVMAGPAFRIDLRRLTTGVKAVDKLAMLDITWYEFQLARMAKTPSSGSKPQ